MYASIDSSIDSSIDPPAASRLSSHALSQPLRSSGRDSWSGEAPVSKAESESVCVSQRLVLVSCLLFLFLSFFLSLSLSLSRRRFSGATHAMLNCVPLFIAAGPRDIGSECIAPVSAQAPPMRIILFDNHEGGGIGLAEKIARVFIQVRGKRGKDRGIDYTIPKMRRRKTLESCIVSRSLDFDLQSSEACVCLSVCLSLFPLYIYIYTKANNRLSLSSSSSSSLLPICFRLPWPRCSASALVSAPATTAAPHASSGRTAASSTADCRDRARSWCWKRPSKCTARPFRADKVRPNQPTNKQTDQGDARGKKKRNEDG